MTTRPRIWITRTEPAAQRSQAVWEAAGFDPVVAPLLLIEPIRALDPVPDDAALIFTSSHAVRHCGVMPDERPVYTVGDATAKAAREKGFRAVKSAKGDWKKLLKLIEKKEQRYVHISGSVVQGEIIETLKARGFEASRHVVYHSQSLQNWPVDPADLEAVALYSTLASETLMQLPKRPLNHLMAYCLSQNVAAALKGPRIHIADRPTEAALIACSRDADD